ncbi:uncharacterized protein LOC134814174 [Bolinopsis microptera]|uniref:uncharacterized protein LOC134814174 n=1 Tax=Bolinopsis microptera TaxID=2820187 RepID=UPI00307AC1BC
MGEENSFSFSSFASKIKNTGSMIGDATSRLGVGNMNTLTSNMNSLKSNMNIGNLTSNMNNLTSNMNIGNLTSNMNNLTSNMNMGNLTSNLTNMQQKVQDMASLENLEAMSKAGFDGLQAGVGGLEAMSKVGLDGLQAGVGGLEAMSKSVLDTIESNRKRITNVDELKAKGNYQLVGTIKTIEYQLLMFVLYFVLAIFIKWYLIEGVEKSINLIKDSQKFLDDPEFEKNLRKYSDQITDLNQLKQGMDGLTSGIAQSIQDGAKIVQDGATNLRDSAAQRIQDGAKIVTDSASMIKNNIDLDKLNLLKGEEKRVKPNEGKDEI